MDKRWPGRQENDRVLLLWLMLFLVAPDLPVQTHLPLEASDHSRQLSGRVGGWSGPRH